MPYAYSNNGLSVRNVSGGTALIGPLRSNIGTGSLSPVAVSASAVLGVYEVAFTSPTAYSVTGPGGTSIGTGAVGQPFSADGLSFTIEAGSITFQTGAAAIPAVTAVAATETEPEKPEVPEVPAVPPDGFTIDVLELPYVVAAGEVLFSDVASVDELMAAFPNADREALTEVEANRQFHDYMSHIHAQVVALLPPGVTLPHLNWSPEAGRPGGGGAQRRLGRARTEIAAQFMGGDGVKPQCAPCASIAPSPLVQAAIIAAVILP
jgi:hypothetical protein